ncbi:hypothetical protein GN958_ATG07177 [Phytophthora infestans]|uniref:Uncharacterized protein n=1 Tax=Phytophthora infestans TaxID=4787 RepID=A0A8S9UVB5_PHYIN|nr:hypothetical protein GN958_ATG07177 [Phytophthora infestans]
MEFAVATVKEHYYEKNVAATLWFLGRFGGGHREIVAAIDLSRSYVMEIMTEVGRALNKATSTTISFSQ